MRTYIDVNAMAKACGMSVEKFLSATDLDCEFDDRVRRDAIKSIRTRKSKDEWKYPTRRRNALWLLVRFYIKKRRGRKRAAR